jgi:fumarate reductase flavoprotein subunit
LAKERETQSPVSRRQSIKEEEMAKETEVGPRGKEAPKKVSRREFVKGAAVGAAGIAAAGALASCAPAATPAATTAPVATATSVTAPECPPCPTPWIPEKWDKEVDVVVVGFGAGGSAAAIEANDLGAKVILLEKMPTPGGGCCESGGMVYGAVTSVQKAMGIEDSKDAMYKYRIAVGKGLDDPELVRILVDKSAETIDWLVGLGVKFTTVLFSGMEKKYADVAPPAPRGHLSEGLGPGLFKVLDEAVNAREIEVMLETKAVELVANTEKEVLGVKVESKGQPLYIRAAKAVVLTSGSFAMNKEMLSTYQPSFRDAWTVMPMGLDGDGLTMCQRLAADIRGIGIPVTAVPGIRVAQRPDPYATPFKWAISINPPIGGPFIAVNQQGKRFITENLFYELWVPILLAQEGHRAFAIFDEEGRQYEVSPGFAFTKPGVEAEIEAGIVKKADTIRELAGIIGVDPGTLEETVNTWNANAATETDPEFGRTEFFVPIKTPPFYAYETRPAISDPICGVVINTKAQVVDVDGNVIPRLYASGSVTGGWRGEQYPGSGNMIGNAMTFGRIAARNAIAETPWA